MSNLPTSDTAAVLVAEQAYEVTRAALLATGADGLPTWPQVPDTKKIYFTNAARAALDGREVWDVWSFSCGEEPGDATQVLWRQRPPLLQLLPKVFTSFGRAVSGTSVAPTPEPVNLLEDEVPSLEDKTVEEVIEEVGLGDERVSEAISKENEKQDLPEPEPAKKTTRSRRAPAKK